MEYHILYAPLAHLIERLLCTQKVMGSIPLGSTICSFSSTDRACGYGPQDVGSIPTTSAIRGYDVVVTYDLAMVDSSVQVRLAAPLFSNPLDMTVATRYRKVAVVWRQD